MPKRDYDPDSDIDDRPRRRRRPAKRKKSDSNVLVILVCVGACFLLMLGTVVGGYFLLRRGPAPAIGIVESPGGDLERLAGRWECTFRDQTGRVYMHKVKEINGNSETATWYRPDGSVFRINRVEFQLDLRGQQKIFRYFNGWASDGNGVGQPFPSGEYVYTLEGDTWTEFDPGGNIVWTRMR